MNQGGGICSYVEKKILYAFMASCPPNILTYTNSLTIFRLSESYSVCLCLHNFLLLECPTLNQFPEIFLNENFEQKISITVYAI